MLLYSEESSYHVHPVDMRFMLYTGLCELFGRSERKEAVGVL